MARQSQWRDNHNGAANHWRGIIPSQSPGKTPKGRRAASGGLFLKAPSLQPIRPSLPSSWPLNHSLADARSFVGLPPHNHTAGARVAPWLRLGLLGFGCVPKESRRSLLSLAPFGHTTSPAPPPLPAGAAPAPAWGAHRPPDPPSSGCALGLAHVLVLPTPSCRRVQTTPTRSRCAVGVTLLSNE